MVSFHLIDCFRSIDSNNYYFLSLNNLKANWEWSTDPKSSSGGTFYLWIIINSYSCFCNISFWPSLLFKIKIFSFLQMYLLYVKNYSREIDIWYTHAIFKSAKKVPRKRKSLLHINYKAMHMSSRISLD